MLKQELAKITRFKFLLFLRQLVRAYYFALFAEPLG